MARICQSNAVLSSNYLFTCSSQKLLPGWLFNFNLFLMERSIILLNEAVKKLISAIFSCFQQGSKCKTTSFWKKQGVHFWLCSDKDFGNMRHMIASIYPSSFTNVCFSTKIEFSNVAKWRWGSRSAVSSSTSSWRRAGGDSGG